jgi:hypothetical protein
MGDNCPLGIRVFGRRKHRGRRDGPVRHGALLAAVGCICTRPSHCRVEESMELGRLLPGDGGCVMMVGPWWNDELVREAQQMWLRSERWSWRWLYEVDYCVST